MTTTTKRYQNDLERAYLLGYHQAERYQNDLEHAYLLGYHQAERDQSLNLRGWPGITRSRVRTACCEQGYEAGLEAMPLVVARRVAA